MGKQNQKVADRSIVTSANKNELRPVGVNQKRKKINFFKWVDKLFFYDYYKRKIGNIKKRKTGREDLIYSARL